MSSGVKGRDARALLYVFNSAAFFVSHRLDVAMAASRAGYDVHVAVPLGPGVEQIERAGFQYHEISLSRGGISLYDNAKTLASLFQLYRAVRPTIIEHATIKPVLYGSMIARLLNMPRVVNWVTGLGYVFDDADGRAALRVIRQRAIMAFYRIALGRGRTHLIVENPELRSFLHEEAKVPLSAISLIRGAGVDTSRFHPGTDGDEGPPLVTLPARMLKPKGVYEFVEAARVVKRTHADARFALVGGVDLENPAAVSEEQIRRWVKEGIVEWWGMQHDMPRVLRESTIVCLPSYGEGLPKSLIEAAACGKPIVTTDIPGCREVVVDGFNGFLVPPKNSLTLAKVIGTLLEDRSMRLVMGERSRKLAVDNFSVERIQRETLDVYSRSASSLQS